MKKKTRKMILSLIAVLLLLNIITLGGMIALFVVYSGMQKPDEAGEPIREETQYAGPQVSDNEAAVPASVYPAPEYAFRTEDVYVVEEGLEKEYTIAFVNDVHLITNLEPCEDVTEESIETITNRYRTLSVDREGKPAEELWPEIIQFLNYQDFDAVIFGGDILDYNSHSNMAAMRNGFDRLKYPRDRVMYIRSDHDYGGWYGGDDFHDEDGFRLQEALWDKDSVEKRIELDEISIVGVNQSYHNLSEHSREVLEKELDAGKPVLLATHVPFYSEVDESLEELSVKVRNRIYYWNPENSSYKPDAETQAFIDRVYAKDSPVMMIAAAHIHAKWDGYVTEELRQHVFTPAYTGTIGVIHVVGDPALVPEVPEQTEASQESTEAEPSEAIQPTAASEQTEASQHTIEQKKSEGTSTEKKDTTSLKEKLKKPFQK